MKTIHRTNLQVLNSPFKRTLLILIASLAGAIGGQAAISVGPTGSGTITFDAFPAPRDWSTITNTGAGGDIVDAAGLDLAVQTNAASAITEQLGASGATAPAIGSAGVARWNSSLLAVQTVPTGVGYVSLMATLQNNTGVNQTALTFSYDLTENHATGGTNANAVVEEVPGHRVYYSASGAPGSWQVIPEVSSIGNSGTLIATANVGSWPNGGLIYILWADDNATADRNNTNNEEGGYLIDNVTFKAGVISKAISVGPAGSGTITFDTYPNVLEGWYTMVHTGASADIPDSGTMDSTVQTNVGAAFNRQLGNSATVTPSTTSFGIARWNYTLHAIETVPTGVGYVSLLAAVKNNTGGAQSALTLTYDLGEQNAAGTTVVEEVPGHRVYFSLTGESGSWTVIPGLSSSDTPGTISATLSLGSWPNGGLLYILWADDNAAANRDNANNEEGGYTIDNVSFIPGAINGALITGPTNGQTFPLGVPITINAIASMPGTVTDVAFYHDGVLIGDDATAPYSAIYSNTTLGAHSLQAAASDNLVNMANSTPVTITVVPNHPPVVDLTQPANGASFFVGVNVTNTANASDSDGSVVKVEFYVDGALLFTDNTSPYSCELCDITAGAHTISAVAEDNGGFRGTNTVSINATNPPNIAVLLPNGSTWKYLDDGSDQGTSWRGFFFSDAGWASGVAELGYGDATGNNRPERTVVSYGSDPNAKHPTTYFRKNFTVSDPSIFTNLVVRLLRDDSGIVYINETEVFRSGLTNETWDFSTYTQPGITDDGTIYQTTNVSPFVLLAGDNVVAVEIHQDSTNSSDISFDLMLWGEPGGPSLKITPLSATQADVSWPFPSTGYVLEFKTSLGSPTWSLDVTDPDVPSGASHHVTVSTASSRRFFRLRKP